MQPKHFLVGFLTFALLLSACAREESNPIPPGVNYDPNAMKGFPCHQMGEMWMGDCEFDENGNVVNSMNGGGQTSDDVFSQSTEGLADAKPSEIVQLADGDTYELSADIVKQEVGNRTIKRLAYNGQIPGPLFKVAEGSQITVNFTNNLDIDTTIHSHGLRLDNAFDGVPNVTQDPIAPGESFSYTLKFPDAGIYWYHPHIREDYTQELGLYGNMLVDPSTADYWAPVDREVAWIVDDIFVNEDHPAFDTEHTSHALMGRYGNVLLLNNEEEYRLDAEVGETVRFYLTNVANTRVFNVGIDGVETKFVGGDVGRIEQEVLMDDFLLAPAERAVFEAQFDAVGTYDVVHSTPDGRAVIGKVVVSGGAETAGNFDLLRSNPSDYAVIRDDMAAWLAQEPDKALRISIDMPGIIMGSMGMMEMMDEHHADGIEWEDTMVAVNSTSTSDEVLWHLIDEDTGKENMDIDWSFQQGDMVKIRLYNDPTSLHPMQHPIHFHGQRFVILSRDGEPNENLQWKDTALIPTGETMDIVVEMTNPGMWMAHCHIAEHLHSGMMFGFEVL